MSCSHRCLSIRPPHAHSSAALTGAQAFAPFRGMPAADTEALADLIVRLSHFAANHGDDIDAIDLNPVIVHAQGEGVSVVDALIMRRDKGGHATE